MSNLRKTFFHLARDVRTVGAAIIIFGTLLTAGYAKIPVVRQVAAHAEEIKEVIKRAEEHQDNFNKFVTEQRVAVGKQEQAAELTKEVMLRLLDKMDGT